MAASVLSSPPFDMAVIYFAFFALIVGVIVFIGVILLEAFILRLMAWGSIWHSLLGAFLTNVVTTVLGYFTVSELRIIPPDLDDSNFLATFGIMWAISVMVEGALLLLIWRRPAQKTWAASLAANVASYTALFILWLCITQCH